MVVPCAYFLPDPLCGEWPFVVPDDRSARSGSRNGRRRHLKSPGQWKDPSLAARTASQTTVSGRTASGRLSFAKIREPLEVPDLLALQTESFDWLLGNERWQARVAEAKAEGRTDVPDRSGLEEIFEEISPIEDFGGSMSLSFLDHRF